MTTLTFQTPDEARAWDMYVAAGVINHTNVSAEHALRADDLILERRKRMAPEKVEREWIPHKPGDPMPCDGETLVEVKFVDQSVRKPTQAKHLEWGWSADIIDIISWRPA